MTTSRIQLTLFIEEYTALPIEKIRQEFNPEQYKLIKSHVTLCREDELEPLETVRLQLRKLSFAPIAIDFGAVVRFADGKGVLMPAIGDNEPFQQLRALILQGLPEKPRRHEPHITLIHPRNGTCTDAVFEAIQTRQLPRTIQFSKISLIEQEPDAPWTIVEEFGANWL